MSKDFSLRRIFDQTYYIIKENVVKNGGSIIDVCTRASPDVVTALSGGNDIIEMWRNYFSSVSFIGYGLPCNDREATALNDKSQYDSISNFRCTVYTLRYISINL